LICSSSSRSLVAAFALKNQNRSSSAGKLNAKGKEVQTNNRAEWRPTNSEQQTL
jgi:hypothetical protein